MCLGCLANSNYAVVVVDKENTALDLRVEVETLLPLGLPLSTQDLVDSFWWNVIDHQPYYSPDLAQSDFHLFIHL